ncbi:uncharacterized protein CMU_012540 [Cryptosporidium muris RN66]|uniref:Origin recognition complex subunit 5 C-terminal domain-containing protein n=1 Tax=Cryptosporidium muris (strain RN66) TaxID=441375 RepID=B6AEG3_CRYMR|nr:uncharacterized protein CMU_012540 [Cryptosporidium muris RN66]EEA06580.1 hypothetical protein, conserved [Cryptosporidium muris RN66]|eukprot:XP_002140929.1 hypothetical protein [Cryptosporidium muris RN66]
MTAQDEIRLSIASKASIFDGKISHMEGSDVKSNEKLHNTLKSNYSPQIQIALDKLYTKYGEPRLNEILKIANMIGYVENPVPYLQIIGMPGSGKFSIIRDFLSYSNFPFGIINGCYSKWLSNSRDTFNKISADNIFLSPIQQLRRILEKNGMKSLKRRRQTKTEGLNDNEDIELGTTHKLIEFINQLRLLKREYTEYIYNNEDSTTRKSIFLIVKDVSTIAKNRPDILVALLSLHEHLWDVLWLSKLNSRIRDDVKVNVSVIFIDNIGIPDDLLCNHPQPPIIWFQSYSDIQCYKILTNAFNNSYILEDLFDCAYLESDRTQTKGVVYNIVTQSLKDSYSSDTLEIMDDSNESYRICLPLIKKKSEFIVDYIPKDILYVFWTEFIAEILTALYPYIRSNFRELLFIIQIMWPIALYPLCIGEVNISRSVLDGDLTTLHDTIQALILRLRRHFSIMIRNIGTHYISDLFQSDLISLKNSRKILLYGSLIDSSHTDLPYFAKILLVAAYIASLVPRSNDKKLFLSLITLKLNSSKKRKKSLYLNKKDNQLSNDGSFSLNRWLGIADCISLHISGKEGIEQSVSILEQVNNIVRLGLVLPLNSKWSQMVRSRGEKFGTLEQICPLSMLSIGDNMAITMASMRNITKTSTTIKLPSIEAPINIDNPRSMYSLQAPKTMIETCAIDIGLLLNEIIPK